MDAEIIDLVAIAAACKPLAAWWRQFSVNGDASPNDLERARRQLEMLAPTAGPVGRAVERIVSAESQTNTGQVLASLELLVRIAACISDSVADGPRPRGTTWKKPYRGSDKRCQPVLPGFGCR